MFCRAARWIRPEPGVYEQGARPLDHLHLFVCEVRARGDERAYSCAFIIPEEEASRVALYALALIVAQVIPGRVDAPLEHARDHPNKRWRGVGEAKLLREDDREGRRVGLDIRERGLHEVALSKPDAEAVAALLEGFWFIIHHASPGL